MNAATLINQTSGKTEYYTPAPIIEAARRTMGGIDLDPASCEQANQIVKAGHIFTVAKSGLAQPWFGRVWMNHPFGRSANDAWITKLNISYLTKQVEQACCITFACTSEAWFLPLFAYPMCFLSPRTNYLDARGQIVRGVTKGSVVTYMGPNIQRFLEEFRELGKVMRPLGMES